MIHMIFYAPYPQIVPLIKQVFQERPDCDELEYEIVQDFYNNPLQDLNTDVVDLSHIADLLGLGDAARVCQVGLDHIQGAILKELTEAPAGVAALARCQRQAACLLGCLTLR